MREKRSKKVKKKRMLGEGRGKSKKKLKTTDCSRSGLTRKLGKKKKNHEGDVRIRRKNKEEEKIATREEGRTENER